jgi:hypothetical protein
MADENLVIPKPIAPLAEPEILTAFQMAHARFRAAGSDPQDAMASALVAVLTPRQFRDFHAFVRGDMDDIYPQRRNGPDMFEGLVQLGEDYYLNMKDEYGFEDLT